MVERNVLSILAKSDFEFNVQFEVCGEKIDGVKKEKIDEIRRS
jgi:hypothetical protein